ncbi:MAG: hypothetical protein P9L92_14845 [Candidatus Electryonea clarkiae]|nr:hypothetical protein [Candidatus Electryonea clarkiae]MDP8286230.1 hypothetical protein [Candidatus Electryonea clarkiae]
MREITELSLTIGNWGAKPYRTEIKSQLINVFAEWCRENGTKIRIELYGGSGTDLELAKTVKQLQQEDYPVEPLIRLEPRSDRFRIIGRSECQHVVFEVPVSRQRASARFLSAGIDQAGEYAKKAVESAALNGLHPEIALTDITRAKEEDVEKIVNQVNESLLPRKAKARWRLVDDAGLGDPLPGSRRPKSMRGWVAFFREHLNVNAEDISVQCSDLLGLGLANTLAGHSNGGCPVTSLFGLGHRAGWAATELAMLHALGENINIKELIGLKSLLDPGNIRRDQYRPVSGYNSWETPSETTPDKMEKKIEAWLPFDPHPITGLRIEPLITSLSGKAGLLHLIHRHNPETHVDTDDSRIEEIYNELSRQFNEGRLIPVSWAELEPVAKKSGLI